MMKIHDDNDDNDDDEDGARHIPVRGTTAAPVVAIVDEYHSHPCDFYTCPLSICFTIMPFSLSFLHRNLLREETFDSIIAV